jgi:hypothetical protein
MEKKQTENLEIEVRTTKLEGYILMRDFCKASGLTYSGVRDRALAKQSLRDKTYLWLGKIYVHKKFYTDYFQKNPITAQPLGVIKVELKHLDNLFEFSAFMESNGLDFDQEFFEYIRARFKKEKFMS